MTLKSKISLKQLIKEEVVKALRYRLESTNASEDSWTIELTNGYMLIGPRTNLSKAKMLAKKIEAAIAEAQQDAYETGRSEDAIMDAGDDAMYHFEPMLQKIGFRIEI